MRSLTVLTLLASLALPLSAAEPINVPTNVRALAAMVAASNREPDARLARRLYAMKLTDRLSTARLAGLQAQLPGEESRKALLALADSSAFLNLPPEDIPTTAPLDPTAQKELLDKSVDYVRKQIPLWPDFMATQNEVQFSDVPAKPPRHTENKPYDETLHVAYQSSATVRFLGGKEELAPNLAPGPAPIPVRGNAAKPAGATLSVQGVFGPIFTVVLKDLPLSHPSFSHWETGVAGPIAVFAYHATRDKSHYVVQDSEGQGILEPFAAYHGEIGLDPDTGAILRLTLIAEPRPNSPVARADILIEYAPQKLGPKSYICPVKSVAISLARDVIPMEALYTYPVSALPPFKLELNDTAYSEYHLFRTEMRIVPPNTPAATPADGATPRQAHPQR